MKRSIIRLIKILPYLLGIKKRKGVLVYLGVHRGESFSDIFYKYKKAIGFEANPELYNNLPKLLKWYPNTEIFNCAVSDKDGEMQFNISSNGGASSSLGNFKKEWENPVEMIETITVPSINLMRFLNDQGIKYIDDYVSDIQGFDLEVIKTIRPMIEEKRITSITCETTKDQFGNIYDEAPDNSFQGFKDILQENYECVSTGWGLLEDGSFEEVPESWWEFDAKWKLKQSKPENQR